jgi:PAS domain S-box-containing protein
MSTGELIRLARVNAAPVLVVDGDGTVAAANPAAAQALDTPCETLIGQPLSDLAAGSPEQVGRALRACSRSGEPVLGKLLLSKADGSTLPFPYKGILLRPPTNATPALVWLQLQEYEQFITHNFEIRRLQAEIHQRRRAEEALQKHTEALQHEVTARKRVEESLLESQSKLRSVLGTIPDFVLSMDLEGTILFINRSATTQTPEQVVGTSAFDYLPPGHHRILQEALEAVFQTGEVQTIEHILDGEQNGAEVWLASRIGPIRKETEIVGVTVVSTDISERRQREKKLRTLHQAVEQSSSTIVITDADGNVEYANPQFEVSTGYTLEEVYGQNPRMLKSGKHSPEFYEELWKTVSSGQEWRGELLNKRKDGTLYWEAACISPVLDAQGRIVQYVGESNAGSCVSRFVNRITQQGLDSSFHSECD